MKHCCPVSCTAPPRPTCHCCEASTSGVASLNVKLLFRNVTLLPRLIQTASHQAALASPFRAVTLAALNTALLCPHTVSRHSSFVIQSLPPHHTPGGVLSGPQAFFRTSCAATVMVPPVHERLADLTPGRFPKPTKLRLQEAAPAVAPASAVGVSVSADCPKATGSRSRHDNKMTDRNDCIWDRECRNLRLLICSIHSRILLRRTAIVA